MNQHAKISHELLDGFQPGNIVPINLPGSPTSRSAKKRIAAFKAVFKVISRKGGKNQMTMWTHLAMRECLFNGSHNNYSLDYQFDGTYFVCCQWYKFKSLGDLLDKTACLRLQAWLEPFFLNPKRHVFRGWGDLIYFMNSLLIYAIRFPKLERQVVHRISQLPKSIQSSDFKYFNYSLFKKYGVYPKFILCYLEIMSKKDLDCLFRINDGLSLNGHIDMNPKPTPAQLAKLASLEPLYNVRPSKSLLKLALLQIRAYEISKKQKVKYQFLWHEKMRRYEVDFLWEHLHLFVRLEKVLKNHLKIINRPELLNLMDYLSNLNSEELKKLAQSPTVESIQRRCERWHQQFHERNEIQGTRKDLPINLSWRGVQKPDLKFHFKKLNKWIELKQIKTYKNLINEGQEMEHCVPLYVDQCRANGTSIWSVKIKDAKNEFELERYTLQLTNNEVIQFRGKNNRKPSTLGIKALDAITLENEWKNRIN